MLYAFAVATVLIALAELGDKSQLLVLALACRYRTRQVLIGMVAAGLALMLIATLAGQVVGNLIPRFWLSIVTGLLFVGFGVWTLRESDEGEECADDRGARFGPILTVAAAFFLAELGDKTQIMTMAIAADPAVVLRTLGAAGPSVASALASVGLTGEGLTPVQSFLGVWLGSTFGMMLADGLAVLVGAVLGKHLPHRLIRRISGVVFIVFGVATLLAALLGGS